MLIFGLEIIPPADAMLQMWPWSRSIISPIIAWATSIGATALMLMVLWISSTLFLSKVLLLVMTPAHWMSTSTKPHSCFTRA